LPLIFLIVVFLAFFNCHCSVSSKNKHSIFILNSSVCKSTKFHWSNLFF